MRLHLVLSCDFEESGLYNGCFDIIIVERKNLYRTILEQIILYLIQCI